MVIDDPQQNAFVLPAGKVFFFKVRFFRLCSKLVLVLASSSRVFFCYMCLFSLQGLLPLLDTDDELAAVLAHEMGHVIARHAAESTSYGCR